MKRSSADGVICVTNGAAFLGGGEVLKITQ